MTRFIKKYVYACLDCAYKRSQYEKREGFLYPINKPDYPLHIWHMTPWSLTQKVLDTFIF